MPAPSPSNPAPVVHFEIGCQNMESTRAFYSALLGWQSQPNGPMMAMLTNLGEMGQPKTMGIGGHLTALGHPPHQYVTVYAMVDDIEATLAHAVKLGGTLLIPKTEVPGAGWFAWFKDPEGNCLGLWTANMAAMKR